MNDFHAGSLTHLMMLIGLAVLSAALVGFGRALRCRSLEKALHFDRALALAAAVMWLFLTAHDMMPGHLRWDKSLPLHICDVTGLLVPVALWTHRRVARAMLYFWGLGLCSQAFITPMLFVGPAHLDFWTYCICHTVIVAAAIYDYLARGYRPTWRDWRIGVVISAAYVLTVLPVDIRLGVNYGYLGRSNFAQPAVVLGLGPWPDRVPRLVAIVWIGMAAMVPLGARRREPLDGSNPAFTAPASCRSLGNPPMHPNS